MTTISASGVFVPVDGRKNTTSASCTCQDQLGHKYRSGMQQPNAAQGHARDALRWFPCRRCIWYLLHCVLLYKKQLQVKQSSGNYWNNTVKVHRCILELFPTHSCPIKSRSFLKSCTTDEDLRIEMSCIEWLPLLWSAPISACSSTTEMLLNMLNMVNVSPIVVPSLPLVYRIQYTPTWLHWSYACVECEALSHVAHTSLQPAHSWLSTFLLYSATVYETFA